MKRNRIFLMLALATVSLTIAAAPRAKGQMKEAAVKAINAQRTLLKMGPRRAAELKTLKTTAAYDILGYEGGNFAVIAADDVAPAVLGVSLKRYNEENTNFMWWLNAVEQVVTYAAQQNMPLTTTKPDPTKYPTAVPPMLTTEWDQLEPYNNLLPLSQGGDRVYTGCVATAMAQVLNYYKTPEHGIGQRTIYYPQHDTTGSPITATFGDDYYDWDNMLDRYVGGNYNQAQAQAVAVLMRDCGVAADMQYGGYMENGSGAYSQDAAAGLRTYFGFAEAECLERDYYSEPVWMDIVYRELSENGPVYYGGASYESGGHAFVLHGYNAQGQVYVNWGWSGEDDGYYDIALLNPGYYHFEIQQDMIIGVKGIPVDLTDEAVSLAQAGTLSSLLGDDKIGTVGTLKVTGNINSTDLRQIRRLAGMDEYGEKTKGYLKELDLSEARIVSGGDAYLIDGTKQLTTTDDELPARAFYGCRYLRTVKLPAGLKTFGEGAFALCQMLNDIQMGAVADDANFVIEDDVVWNKEKTEIIAVLPVKTGEYAIPDGTTALHDYALSGCAKLSSVRIPQSVETIGREAMNGCNGLNSIHVNREEPPTLTGANVFKGITYWTCYLYVPSGSQTKYAQKAQWSDFKGDGYDNIIGFGSAVKVRNTIRLYGEENPQFLYTVDGDPIQGEPVLTCEATKDSPAGRYPITIEKGTITTDNVKLIDGYLIVQRVQATATIQNATREQGQPNPEFEMTYDGLVNGDTEPVWDVAPVLTCEADENSPAGEYDIVLGNPTEVKAESYTMSFIVGKLTVTPATTGITTVNTDSRQHTNIPTYDISGRRVNGNATNGINIRNGRKVVRR